MFVAAQNHYLDVLIRAYQIDAQATQESFCLNYRAQFGPEGQITAYETAGGLRFLRLSCGFPGRADLCDAAKPARRRYGARS